jgi:hypothetical protein
VHRNSTKRPTGASRKKLRKEELPGARLCHTLVGRRPKVWPSEKVQTPSEATNGDWWRKIDQEQKV